jgi:hypothetical protein
MIVISFITFLSIFDWLIENFLFLVKEGQEVTIKKSEVHCFLSRLYQLLNILKVNSQVDWVFRIFNEIKKF